MQFTTRVFGKPFLQTDSKKMTDPADNLGTVVGENPSCYGILPLWGVNGLSIVCWGPIQDPKKECSKIIHGQTWSCHLCNMNMSFLAGCLIE